MLLLNLDFKIIYINNTLKNDFNTILVVYKISGGIEGSTKTLH